MTFIAADKLRNIHLLKMLAVYPAQARLFEVGDAIEHAALVRLPVAAAGYDSEHYPDARWIGVISTKQAKLASQVIQRALAASDHVPGRWVFKCMDEAAVAAVRAFSAVTRATAFISFTGMPSRTMQQRYEVETTNSPRPAVMDLLASSSGYSRDEVRSLFRDADGCAYWIGDSGAPKAVCMSFAVYDDVYEVAALYTRPESRQQGYARALVVAACSDLRRRNRLMRYQAREDNEPSLALARELGLREFLRLEHWITQDTL